jgi:hypothetical protein
MVQDSSRPPFSKESDLNRDPPFEKKEKGVLLFKQLKDFYLRCPWLSEATVFLIMLILYLPLQASKSFADPDSFYHLKMAELTAASGPIRNFIWLPFTTLANSFADQHFLYHISLIPFIKVFGSFPGMKIATAFFAALAIAAIAWSLRYMGIRYAAAFALIAGTMEPLAFRIGLSKASAPGVALLMIGLALAAKRRKWPLAIIAFIHVWTHGSWPALLGLGTVTIIIVCWERDFRAVGRAIYAPMAALWSGIVLGVIVNPFFPQNLKFYWEQIVQIAVINYQSKIGVGAEWYPYQPTRLAGDLPLLCIMVLVSLLIFPTVISQSKSNGRRGQARIAFALSLCAGAFLILTLRSQRHVEYFVPLAVVACAAWISEMIIGSLSKSFRQNAIVTGVALALLFAFLATYANRELVLAKNALDSGDNFTLYKNAASYLKAHTTPDEIVVNADWSDMPSLFYWDDKNRYITGLDPTFLYSANPSRYWDYINFSSGQTADPAGVMKKLDSRYVFSNHGLVGLDKMLAASGKFTLVYTDKGSEIYSLK